MTPPKETGTAPRGAREIVFELNGHAFSFSTPPPGDTSIPSVFLIGLPKAGSTLLNRLMRPLTTAAGLSYVGLQETLFAMGVAAPAIPAEANAAFAPTGYAFGGFRSIPNGIVIPPYAADRTVLLVRDPRDMLTSLYFSLARSHRPPGTTVGEGLAESFNAQREAISQMGIDEFALERARMVLGQYRTVTNKLTGVPHRVYRYEDVIFDKLPWTRDMLDYLGLAPPPALIEKVVASNDVRPKVEDTSQHVRKVAPGDHREKLRPETIEALNVLFEPILRQHRYF